MQWSSTYTRIVWFVFTLVLLWGLIRSGDAMMVKLERFSKILETAGGKILLLAVMAFIYFVAALGFGYYALDAIQQGKLKEDDVVVNMFVQFVTGSAFGTALGALVSLLGGKHD